MNTLRTTFVICLILGVVLTEIGCSKAQKKSTAPLSTEKSGAEYVIGGPCIYSHYSGSVTIIRIEKREESTKQARTSGGPGYAGYEVWFTFKTNQPIKEEWAHKNIERERLFRLANSWYPGPRYLEKYNIKAGSNYKCTLKVITMGTCTPIIFEFSQLKQDDYFEKAGE